MNTPLAPRFWTTARAAVGMTLALATACSDGGTDPTPVGPNRVSMQYQGPVSGSFAVEGDPRMDMGMLEQTFASGLRYQSPATLEISASRYDAASNMVDAVQIQVPATQPGNFTIDRSQCPWWDDSCAGVSLILQLERRDGQQARYSCMLTSGTVRLAEATSGRARGTFSGVGECLDRDAADGVPSPPLSITGGEFDVKLRTGTRG